MFFRMNVQIHDINETTDETKLLSQTARDKSSYGSIELSQSKRLSKDYNNTRNILILSNLNQIKPDVSESDEEHGTINEIVPFVIQRSSKIAQNSNENYQIQNQSNKNNQSIDLKLIENKIHQEYYKNIYMSNKEAEMISNKRKLAILKSNESFKNNLFK